MASMTRRSRDIPGLIPNISQSVLDQSCQKFLEWAAPARQAGEEKTRVCKVPEGEFDFLGYTLGRMHPAISGSNTRALGVPRTADFFWVAATNVGTQGGRISLSTGNSIAVIESA